MPLKAVFSADIAVVLLQRTFHAVAGLATMVLIARFLSPVEQGWYYSFLSLAATYTLFDLGLSIVLVPVVAQYFEGVVWGRRGQLLGERKERLVALLGRSVRWYAWLALGFVVVLLPAGWWFLGSKGTAAENWMLPWAMMVGATAGILFWMPFLAFVEGSGRITEIFGLRLAQGIVGSACCWVALVTGAGIWSAVMVPSMGLAVLSLWFCLRRPGIVMSAWQEAGRDFDWRGEVWPLQWRLAVSWVCSYLGSQVYTLVLMETQGPVAAGQMGLSIAIANTLGFVAQSWIVRRIPMMAQAGARQDREAMRFAFRWDFGVFAIVFGLGVAILLVLEHFLASSRYVERVLPFWQMIGLLTVVFINQVIGALGAYLRSFRREPFMGLILASTLLALPASIFGAAKYSSGGVIAVLLGVSLCVSLPLALVIWNKEMRNT